MTMTKAEMQTEISRLRAENAVLRRLVIAIRTVLQIVFKRPDFDLVHYEYNDQTFANRVTSAMAYMSGVLQSVGTTTECLTGTVKSAEECIDHLDKTLPYKYERKDSEAITG